MNSEKTKCIPDGWTFVGGEACSVEFDVSVIKNYSHYSNVVQNSLGLDLNLFGFELTASTTWQNISSKLTQDHSMFIHSGASCALTTSKQLPYNPPA